MLNNKNITKKIIIMIIILILFIIILLSILMSISKNNNDNNKEDNISKESVVNNISMQNIITQNNLIENVQNIVEEHKQQELKQTIERVKDNQMFYTIQNCITKFESYVNLDYTKEIDELGYPSLAASYGINNENDKNKAIIDFLDKEFVKKNNITYNNLMNFIDITITSTNTEVLKVNKLIDKDTSVKGYSVYAKKTRDNNTKFVYYIVKLINENVFCIYPIKEGEYSNIDEIIIENNTKFIEKNKRNSYIKSNISEGEIATKYFQQYKKYLLNDSKQAYEKLNKEYREKRFGTINELNEYINKNKNNIQLMQVYRYDKKENNGINEYIIKDRFDNTYIFYESAPNEYTVMLDDYTVPSEEYVQRYNSVSTQTKSIECTKKFIRMINNKDYKNAYKLLNDNFKNNDYNDLEEFILDIEQKLFNMNKIEEIQVEEVDEYYVCTLKISNYEKLDEEMRNIQIIIKLKGNTDFEMSFSFN